jgi:hypothetical protein
MDICLTLRDIPDIPPLFFGHSPHTGEITKVPDFKLVGIVQKRNRQNSSFAESPDFDLLTL